MITKHGNILNSLPPEAKRIYFERKRNPWTTFWCAFFLGGIGGQWFYLRMWFMGFFSLLFCWTLIPLFISFLFMFCSFWATKQYNQELLEELDKIYNL